MCIGSLKKMRDISAGMFSGVGLAAKKSEKVANHRVMCKCKKESAVIVDIQA